MNIQSIAIGINAYKKKNTVLLLTSCINPGGMSYTVLQDKEERKSQYKKAIRFYLEHTKYRIVFCDNSGEDLKEMEEIFVDSRLELLSFHGNDYDKSLGKGYGEFGILQYAFQHSRFIKEATTVVKITGRLIVNNLVEAIGLQDIIYFYPNRFVYAEANAPGTSDSRCIAASKVFFLSVLGVSDNPINDSLGYYLEHYLYDSIKQLPTNYVVSDYAIPLAICGISGTSGVEYECEEMVFAKKLALTRDFCQKKRKLYKGNNVFLYTWISIISFVIRIQKFVCIHLI